MNAGDVVELLSKEGVTLTQSAIKYLAGKYSLYLEKTNSTPHPGFDPKKVKNLVKVLSSDLLLTKIASTNDVRLSQVNYYILKDKLPVDTLYGRKLLKNRKDLGSLNERLQK